MKSDDDSRRKLQVIIENYFGNGLEIMMEKFYRNLQELDEVKQDFTNVIRDYQDIIDMKNQVARILNLNEVCSQTASQEKDNLRSKTPTNMIAQKKSGHKGEDKIDTNINIATQNQNEAFNVDRAKTPQPSYAKLRGIDKIGKVENIEKNGETKNKETIQDKTPLKKKPIPLKNQENNKIEKEHKVLKRELTPVPKPPKRKEDLTPSKTRDDMHHRYNVPSKTQGEKKTNTKSSSISESCPPTTPSTINRRDSGNLKDVTISSFTKKPIVRISDSEKSGMIVPKETKTTISKKHGASKSDIHLKTPKVTIPSINKHSKDDANSSTFTLDKINRNDSFLHNTKNNIMENNKNNNELRLIERDKIKEHIQKWQRRKVKFSSKFLECLYIAGNSQIVPIDLRIRFLCSTREIYSKVGLKGIIGEKLFLLEEQLKENEKILGKYDLSNIIKSFWPSKTAQNGLNFVTKEEEANLSRREQPEEVLNIFRVIYILIDENYKLISPQKLIENLFIVIFKKLEVENIKSLFLNKIAKNTNLSNYQYEELIAIVKENPNIFSSSELLRISRSVSYMTFFLREIYDYITAKLSDGELSFHIRKLYLDVNVLKERINFLKCFI